MEDMICGAGSISISLRMIKMVAGKRATTSRRPSSISSMPQIPPLKAAGAAATGDALQKDGGGAAGAPTGNGEAQPRRRLSFMAPTKSSRLFQRRDA